jgi:hypothetical protein
LNQEQIELIEKKYNSKYVFETCLQNTDGGWINEPAAIFYSEVPHPMGSNYFAFYKAGANLGFMICDAKKHIEGSFIGVRADNGDIIYSRYRHDYRKSPDNSVWVDGGRDYFRSDVNVNTVKFKVVKDKLKLDE